MDTYMRTYIGGQWLPWTTSFLPLKGGTLSGYIDLVQSGAERAARFQQSSQRFAKLVNFKDGENYSQIVLDIETTVPSTLLKVSQKVDNTQTDFNVFHTGNKPTGTYTGSGTATSKTVSTGGIGNALLIISDYGTAIVTQSGRIKIFMPFERSEAKKVYSL